MGGVFRGHWPLRSVMMLVAALVVAVGMAVPASASAVTGRPGAPTGVAALAADHGAVVSWTPPSSDGGSPVTGYVITASPGGLTAHTSVVRSFLVGGLTNGTAYTFTVAAVNAAGKGPASGPSAAVTPKAPVVPGAPRSVAAAAGFEQVTVSWAAPKSDGGATVTGYKVSTRPATTVTSVAGSARSAVVAGLADGTAYTVLVAAVNSVGRGKAVASAPVIPQVTVPGAPEEVTAAPAGPGVKVGWQPPASDGGSAVSGYVVTVTGTATTVTALATARSVTITGLTAGASYTFTVAAANAQGTGAAATSTPATAGATVAAHTVVLSKASLATLTQVGTDGSLVFTSPTAQVQHLAVGDVIAAGVSAATPGGLLAQATSVTPAGSSLTVSTTPASLDQALSAAGFGASTALTSGQVASFTPARRGVRLVPADTVPVPAAPGSIGVSVNVDLYTDNHDAQVTVKGSLTVTPHLSFAASITCCTHTTSQFTGTVTAAESLSLSAQLSHDIAGGLDLGTITFAPITFPVAGVPITIVPDLNLKLVANGTVSIGTVTAGSTLTVGANVTTSDATVKATPIYQLTTSFTPPTVQEPFSAAIGPQAELGTHIDGLPGPFLTDALLLPKLTVDPLHDPWWTLGGENILTLNYELSLLHHNFVDYHATLSDKSFLVSHSLDPYQGVTITPSPAAVAPGGQIQLHAQVAGVTNQNVIWAAAAGGGTITAGGLYTAPATPGTYAVTATQPASGLKPSAIGIIGIRVGDQPPGPPTSPTAASPSYGTATISWQPPADTGGGPVGGYTITATPGGQTQAVSGTATTGTMTGLTPGASYTFTITATNDGGTSVPSPATNPVVIDNTNGGGAGLTWTAIEAPMPANADPSYPAPTMVATACASTTACVAIGQYADTSGNQHGLLLTGSGTTWTPTEAPVPGNAATNPNDFLSAVTCTSTSACTAIGTYTDTSGNVEALLLTGSGTTWTPTEAPLPGNAASNASVGLSAVSCASASACVATGSYRDTSGHQQGLLLTGSGTTWTPTEAPLPGNVGSYAYTTLYAVACASASTCTAVGSYTDSSGHQQGLLLTGSGTTWTAAKAPLPPSVATNPNASVYNLACPAISACTAVGSYTDTSGNVQGLLLTGSGTTWTAAKAPLPADAASNPYAALTAVACTSVSACTAAGSYIDTSGTQQPPFLVTGSGSTWTAIEPPVPANAASAPHAGLNALACPAASECAAAAQYDSAPGNQRASVVTESGTTWTAAEAPLPANANPLGVSWLAGIACPSTVMCVAAGSYDDTYPSLQAFLLIGTGN